MLPTLGLTLQVTLVLPDPVTVAVNGCVCEADKDAKVGVTLTVTGGSKVTVAEALLVTSATLVAVTVTVCWLAIGEGAMYSPLLLMLHVTLMLEEPVTAAVNCWV
jgi:hypothetical protein